MKKILIPLSIAALTLTAIGAGAVQKSVQAADQRLDFPTNAQENEVHSRQIAGQRLSLPGNADETDEHSRRHADRSLEDEYPAPSGDGGSPDIRFPGVPSP